MADETQTQKPPADEKEGEAGKAVKFKALANVPAEMYGGAAGERVERGATFEVDAAQAKVLAKVKVGGKPVVEKA